MIKNFLTAIITTLKQSNIKIGVGTLINKQTSFEGYNSLGKFVSFKNSQIGFCSYIGDGCHLSSVKIGRYCSIASNVIGVTGTHPVDTFISSHPAFYASQNMVDFSYVDKTCFKEHNPAEPGYSIIIGNDVWIGAEVKILEGVHINDGAIIACGAVVTAKVIKYRYSSEIISDLLMINWWNWKPEELADFKEYFNDVSLFVRLAKGKNNSKIEERKE